ncbi:MAG: hypothetical protein M0Z72_01560 [Deltaproteobacteria bacterium]|nr:hypothetical protein [Deltaproteobacteria bacterium]
MKKEETLTQKIGEWFYETNKTKKHNNESRVSFESESDLPFPDFSYIIYIKR